VGHGSYDANEHFVIAGAKHMSQIIRARATPFRHLAAVKLKPRSVARAAPNPLWVITVGMAVFFALVAAIVAVT
jgi:hypothetical protein